MTTRFIRRRKGNLRGRDKPYSSKKGCKSCREDVCNPEKMNGSKSVCGKNLSMTIETSTENEKEYPRG